MSPGAHGTGPDSHDSSGAPGRDGRAARPAVFDMVGTTVESGDEVLRGVGALPGGSVETDRPAAEAPVEIRTVDPGRADARWCLDRYFEELGQRFEGGFDPAASLVVDHSDLVPPHGAFLVASIEGRPVACGAVKCTAPGVGYIKRMWVDGFLRGFGLGRRMLAALEQAAATLGCDVVQLETNRALTEAIRLYRTSGYREVEPFNDEVYAHHWFEKRLGR